MFKERLEAYKVNKHNIENGITNCLSFGPFFPKLSKYIPGLVRGTYYGITSSVNTGKTPFAKFIGVLIPLYWASQGKKIKIFYFCLEESKEQFYDSMVCAKLYRDTKKELSIMQLNSMFDSNNVTQDTLDIISQYEEYFNNFDTKVEVVTHINNPTGIYKHIRAYARDNGKFYYKGEEVTEGGDTYKPNNPDEYVIIITDHINLLHTERGADKLDAAMQKFSTEYILDQVCTKYNYVVINVHQQAAESESESYKSHTNNEASLTTLGDNKRLSRDYMVLFGLNMPQRYNVSTHRGIDISRNGGIMYRGLSILKNRFGPSNIFVPLNINPFACTFNEV